MPYILFNIHSVITIENKIDWPEDLDESLLDEYAESDLDCFEYIDENQQKRHDNLDGDEPR